jgi:acetyltransferase-like isoleucine patch superfamily enzyme
MKMFISKGIRFVKRIISRRKWKKANQHNKTVMLNDFDHQFVKVGRGTYGGLYIRNDCNKSRVIIGNYCSIASGVRFLANCDHPTNQFSTYPFRDLVLNQGGETITKGDIIIDDDVWLGMNAIILSGVHIGQGCIIGAGSVVAHNIPPIFSRYRKSCSYYKEEILR